MRERIAIPFSPRNQHTVAVTLDEAVLAQVRAFAERIELANRKRRRRNKQGLTAKGQESLALRVRGYSGEAALALYLGLPPVRLADEWRAKPDVLCFDCITTDAAHGALIVTPRDRLDMMKVLVIDRSPVFHLCGWYRARDAREEAQRRHSEWWRTERKDGGAWYVPQAYLRALNDVEALVELTRYARGWSATHKGFVLLKSGGKIEFVPDGGGQLKGLEVESWIIDEIPREQWEAEQRGSFDKAPEDWREVLRRAGAAPPEQPHDLTPSEDHDHGP